MDNEYTGYDADCPVVYNPPQVRDGNSGSTLETANATDSLAPVLKDLTQATSETGSGARVVGSATAGNSVSGAVRPDYPEIRVLEPPTRTPVIQVKDASPLDAYEPAKEHKKPLGNRERTGDGLDASY